MTICRNSVTDCRPFSIIGQDGSRFSNLTKAYSHHTGSHRTQREACLVKVVKVAVLNRVFRARIGDQAKPHLQYVLVFSQGALEEAIARRTRD